MNKHTPGPWNYHISDYGLDIFGEDRHVAGESWYPRVFSEGTPEREEKEANARLIAATPELLGELESVTQQLTDLLAAITDMDIQNRFIDDSVNMMREGRIALLSARAAIAKAKGE